MKAVVAVALWCQDLRSGWDIFRLARRCRARDEKVALLFEFLPVSRDER